MVTFSCSEPVLCISELLCCALCIERAPPPALVADMIIEVIGVMKNNSLCVSCSPRT